jgi:hypothetical protein
VRFMPAHAVVDNGLSSLSLWRRNLPCGLYPPSSRLPILSSNVSPARATSSHGLNGSCASRASLEDPNRRRRSRAEALTE